MSSHLPEPQIHSFPSDEISQIIPHHYDVTIIPDMKNRNFSGIVSLHYNQKGIFSYLLLHVDPTLTIQRPPFSFYNATSNILKVSLPSSGKSLTIEYSGKIHDDNYGLYSTFDPRSNISGLSTQFEPEYARRVIPCVDSPHARSTYILKLFVQGDLHALSNTEAERIYNYSYAGMQGKIYSFKKTPPMPSYLLSFCIGKWETITGKTNSNVFVDIHSPISVKNMSAFSLDLAISSIEFFEEYTKVKYPLTRLQLVAIPNFAAGAMENWGLVTFREIYLMANEESSSPQTLSTVAEVVVHENAHMWVGNLVSPKSWYETWLNEGFATILPLLCLEKIAPKYSSWNNLYHQITSQAMIFDFSEYTHPILSSIGDLNPELMFDAISYKKGATILNMLRLRIGDDCFRDCLTNYLNKFKYTSTTTQQLVESFEETSHVDIKVFLDKWTKLSGFPTLYVSKTNEKVHIKQSRLMMSGKEVLQFWPFKLYSTSGTEYYVSEIITEITSTEEVFFNPGRRTMAIIHYSEDILNTIIKKWESLNDEIKWVLIDDLVFLSLAGKVSPIRLIEIIEVAIREKSELVIESLIGASEFILSLNDNYSSLIEKTMINYIPIPFPTDLTTNEARIQSRIIDMLGFISKTPIIINALNNLSNYESNLKELQAAYSMKYRVSYQNGFNSVFSIYNSSDNPQMSINALIACGYSDDQNHIEMLIKGFGSMIKWENSIILMRSISNNRKHRKYLLDYLLQNSLLLYKTFGSNFQLQRICDIGFSLVKNNEESSILYSNLISNFGAEMHNTVNQMKEKADSRFRANTLLNK